jgi:hypothetical protein
VGLLPLKAKNGKKSFIAFDPQVFFSSSALGFGHLAPESWQGKLFCIFYSLLGVPINGILIGSLGTFFGSKVRILGVEGIGPSKPGIKVRWSGVSV